MSGEKPGKRRVALLAFASLGAAFILNAVFFVNGQPAAQQQPVTVQKDSATGVETVGAVPPAFSLRIQKDAGRIKLKGYMPSEEDHKTLLGLVKANFASIDITDRVKTAKGDPNANVKVGGVNFALKVLGCLETGTATIDNGGVTLGGVAATSVLYAEARRHIEDGRPTGIDVKSANIAPPSKALKWSAAFSDGHLSMSGVVPGESDIKVLDSTARELFGREIDNSTRISENTPESWMKAALHSLKLLRSLKSGSVQMTDQSIHVEGIAVDETAMKAVDALADKYPRGFSLESKVNAAERASMLSIPHAAAAERSADGD